MLGSLKEDVLIALVAAGRHQPAAVIFDMVNGARSTNGFGGLSFGSVYTTMERLVKDKLVSVKFEQAPSGRKQKLFTITANGKTALERAEAVRNKLRAPMSASGGLGFA